MRFAPEATQVRLAQALAAMTQEACDRLAQGLSELVAQMGIEGSPRMFFEEEGAPPPARAPKKRTPHG